jgi:hypothetical protein
MQRSYPYYKIFRLWKHEMVRVFCDRLVDVHDRDFFHSQMRHAVETYFGVDFLSIEDVVFGDFSRNRGEPEYHEHQLSHVKNLLKVCGCGMHVGCSLVRVFMYVHIM